MVKKHRMYYIPGLISLVLLPIICYFYLQGFKKNDHVIETVFPLKYVPHVNYENNLRLDTTVLSLSQFRRKYVDFKLDSNLLTNQIQLYSFDKKMQYLINHKDTTNGLHLIFGKGFKYGDFIKSINICRKDTFSHYLVYDNELWYLFIKTDPERKKSILNRHKEDLERILNREMEINNLPVSEKYSELPKIWPSIIVLVLLGFLSIRAAIKR